MELDIIIEKLDDDIIIPADNCEGLQIRSDGILLNDELHLWEEILTVIITNRKLLNELKAIKSVERQNKTYVCNCGNLYVSGGGNSKCIKCQDRRTTN